MTLECFKSSLNRLSKLLLNPPKAPLWTLFKIHFRSNAHMWLSWPVEKISQTSFQWNNERIKLCSAKWFLLTVEIREYKNRILPVNNSYNCKTLDSCKGRGHLVFEFRINDFIIGDICINKVRIKKFNSIWNNW